MIQPMMPPQRHSDPGGFTEKISTRFFSLRLCVVVVVALILAACEPQATPIPAVLPPTATPIPVPTLPPPLRYAFTASTTGYIADLEQIRQTGLVEQLSDNNVDEGVIAGYDIVATFGLIEGWQQSPAFPHIALVINADVTPLDNALVLDTVKNSLQPAAIVEALAISSAEANPLPAVDNAALRTALANAGYPDGFDLVLALRVLPGTDLVASQLQEANLNVSTIELTPDDVVSTFEQKRAHLLVIAWGTPEDRAAWVERAGESNVIDLYTLPISYRVQGDLQPGFTADGFPFAAR